MLQSAIDKALKTALLAGDKQTATTLRGLKSALQYEAMAKGRQVESLSEDQAQAVLLKEVKKRSEAAELYQRGGDQRRAAAELAERRLIEGFLPEKMSDDELRQLVAKHVAALGASGPADIGKVIAAVRQESGAAAEGSAIAAAAKQLLGGGS